MPKTTGGASTEDAKAGKLMIDTDKLKAALAADYTKVRELFSGKGADQGHLRTSSRDYVGTQTGTNGMLTGRMRATTRRSRTSPTQIDKLNERMDDRGEAPQGAVRGHGDGAQQLADAAGLAHEPDRDAARRYG